MSSQGKESDEKMSTDTNTNMRSHEEAQDMFDLIFFVKEDDEEELVMSHFITDYDRHKVPLPDAIRRYKQKGELFTIALNSRWGITIKIDELRISGLTFDIVKPTYTHYPVQISWGDDDE